MRMSTGIEMKNANLIKALDSQETAPRNHLNQDNIQQVLVLYQETHL